MNGYCLNPIHLPPLAPNQCPHLTGSLFQQSHVNPITPTARAPQLKFITREEALASNMFSGPQPGVEVDNSQPAVNTRTTGVADNTAAPGLLDHLWLAAERFFEAMQPAPVAAPVPSPAPPPAQAASLEAKADATSAGGLSPERLARRKALTLLKEKTGMNAAQARELFDAYKEAGIPINEHTVSPYHSVNYAGGYEMLIDNPIRMVWKANFRVDGKVVTRVMKFKSCEPTEAADTGRFPWGLESPFRGGRHCEMHTLAASAISRDLGWNVVPESWLGSFQGNDGKLHLILAMEYLPVVQPDPAMVDDPQYQLGLERLQLLSSLIEEEDNARPLVAREQRNGKTVLRIYSGDFESAFGHSVQMSSNAKNYPVAGFGPPVTLHAQTHKEFMALLNAPTRIGALLKPFEIMPAIVAVQGRAKALKVFCTDLMERGQVR
jgi:hypothetical protein